MCGIVCAFTLRAQQSQQSQSRPGGQECPSPASVSQPLAQRGIRAENSGQTEYCRRESQTDMIGRTIQDVEGIASVPADTVSSSARPSPMRRAVYPSSSPPNSRLPKKCCASACRVRAVIQRQYSPFLRTRPTSNAPGFLPQVRPWSAPRKGLLPETSPRQSPATPEKAAEKAESSEGCASGAGEQADRADFLP